jgi:hypothetical protein
MKPEIGISLVALVLSALAFARTVMWDRRSRRAAILRKKQRLVEAVLGNQLTLSELYSNVLTTDPSTYRVEVRNVLSAMRERPPEMIAQTESAHRTLESLQVLDEQVLDTLASQLAQEKQRALALSNELQHGLESGWRDAGTEPRAGADGEDAAAQA